MVPQLWPTLSITHRLVIPIAVALPHHFLYLTVTTSSAIALRDANHEPTAPSSIQHRTAHQFGQSHFTALHVYPYDYLLYHPGYFCSTCRVPKPPRSKHCSLCRACIQKADHHCIWVNNCVGRNNYLYFLLLLCAITNLLVYGTLLGWGSMRARLEARYAPKELLRGSQSGKAWNVGVDWGVWFDRLAWAMMSDVRIGSVTLLCLMCVPLGAAFLIYHVYLLWAGMTTNEQGKWADWKEDIADEVVFRAEIELLRQGMDVGVQGATATGKRAGAAEDAGAELGAYPPLPVDIEPPAQRVDWPPSRVPKWLWDAGGSSASKSRARWWYIRTRNGEQPTLKVPSAVARAEGLAAVYPGSSGHGEEIDNGSGSSRSNDEVEIEDLRWMRISNMRGEVDNIYDLGFWGNLMEAIYNREK
jgi:hypothetical protein